MSTKRRILLVEDNEFAALVATQILSPEYIVQHVSSGPAALEAINLELPDLVLLDVEMPGMSGYEVCHTLRNDPNIGDVAVIFLSGGISDEERLAGYEAGGDDYLTKPVLAAELRSKIRHELESYADRRKLKAQLNNAFSTAMTAMSSSSEIGSILQFIRTSYECTDYTALCIEVLSTLAALGFEASARINGKQGCVSYSHNSPCSTLENSVLVNMSTQGRLFEFGTRTSCSYKHITIIVKSDPAIDSLRHDRMKDNLAFLAEGADACVVALDRNTEMSSQHAALLQLNTTATRALQEIELKHRAQSHRSNQIFTELQSDFDRSMINIGITQSQEEELAGFLLKAGRSARALYEEGLEINTHMKAILEKLESAGARKS